MTLQLTSPLRGSVGHVDPMLLSADETMVDTESFVRAAATLAAELPVALRDAVASFKQSSHASGAMLLRRMPIGEIPATPVTPTTPSAKDRESELTLLGVASLLGEPVGYLPELGGRVVQNLLPVQANANRQTSTSSAVTLMWHTETAFHPHKPQYLLLLCLRGDSRVRTLLCSIDAILSTLSDHTINVLREPRFRIAPDESFLHEGSTREFGAPLSVLVGSGDDLAFTFDADLMVGIDEEATAALQEVSAHIEQQHIGVVLEAGDLLIVDNQRAVHGRSSFAARFDGTDRWLQRTFVVNNLEPSEPERTGRIITTKF
jgi:L-asparagine oxygenase